MNHFVQKLLPIIRSTTLIGLIGSSLLAEAGELAANVLLDQYNAKMHSLSTQFVQTVSDASGRQLERQTGVLKLQKPNQFYLHYQQPKASEQYIISNGKTMWVYAVDLEEASVSDLEESMQNSPVALLLRGAKLSSQYQIRDRGSVEDKRVIELSSKQNSHNYGFVLLVFDAKQNLIKMRLQDQLENTTTLDFSHTKINSAMPAGQFEFVAPKGVYVSGGK